MTSQSQNFWNFSVALYAEEGVADACLDLQNSCGVDVNMLLFCYWHGMHLGEISPATMQQASTLSETWKQEVVQPLRHTRQWMKLHANSNSGTNPAQFEALRARIKMDELEAEKYQQGQLEQMALASADLRRGVNSVEACAKNLEKFFESIGLQQNDMIMLNLASITKALPTKF